MLFQSGVRNINYWAGLRMKKINGTERKKERENNEREIRKKYINERETQK